MNPCGFPIYTSSSKKPCKNALNTSNYVMGQLKVTTNERTKIMDDLITGVVPFISNYMMVRRART